MRARVVIAIVGMAVAALVTPTGAAPQMQVSGGQGLGGMSLMGPGGSTPMATGSGVIFGRATEPGATQPVAGALVTLSLPGAAPLRMLSDNQGRFAFRDLPKGRFSLTATKAGYSDGAYGRERPGGQGNALELTDDQHVSDATVTLWKYATIAGVVLDESGEPIIGAAVRALKRGIVAGKRQLTQAGSGTTDDRGMYRISGLEAADYVIALPMSQGQSSLDSLLQGVDFPREMLGGGGSGGAAVGFAMNIQVNAGGGGGSSTTSSISYSSDDTPMAPGGMTDDGHLMWYQTVFYPTALSGSRATPITLGSGEHREGIDFQLKPVRTVDVSGTLMAPDGPAASTTLSLFPAEADDLVTPIETATTSSSGSGTFTFASVPPGQYVLRATRMPRSDFGGDTQTITSAGSTMVFRSITRTSDSPAPPLPTDPTLSVEMPVTVGTSDVKDILATLRPGSKVSGRVDFDGSAQKPTSDQLSAIGISLEPADGRTSGVASTARGRVDANGTFTTVGVPAGKYVLRVNAPKDWSLRGAIAGGRDISDAAIEIRDGDVEGVDITFTDQPTSLTGTVTDASGAPDATADVIIFPTDRTAWSGDGRSPRREKNVRTGTDGSFTVSNLPVGDYFVVAVSDSAATDWDDPKFLDSIAPGATRLHLAEGDKPTQALHTMKAPGR